MKGWDNMNNIKKSGGSKGWDNLKQKKCPHGNIQCSSYLLSKGLRN